MERDGRTAGLEKNYYLPDKARQAPELTVMVVLELVRPRMMHAPSCTRRLLQASLPHREGAWGGGL